MLGLRPAAFDSGGNVQIAVHVPTADARVVAEAAIQKIAAQAGVRLTGDDVVRMDQIESILQQLRAQQLGFLIAAALSLLVSALGIMNIGLASIAERARELVVRRALGATRTSVGAQLLGSALVVGICTASVAAIITIVIVLYVVPSYIPPQSAIDPPGIPGRRCSLGPSLRARRLCREGSSLPSLQADSM